jgi:hypothetical protein
MDDRAVEFAWLCVEEGAMKAPNCRETPISLSVTKKFLDDCDN